MYDLQPVKTKRKKRKLLNKKSLSIDFDGVIHDYKNPLKDRRMGEPHLGCKQAMKKLAKKYRLYIYTVKAQKPEGKKLVEDWLKYYGIPYTEVTAIKPNAEVYIDDRAYRHTDWESTLEMIGDLDV